MNEKIIINTLLTECQTEEEILKAESKNRIDYDFHKTIPLSEFVVQMSVKIRFFRR
jgi:hypothetical protein